MKAIAKMFQKWSFLKMHKTYHANEIGTLSTEGRVLLVCVCVCVTNDFYKMLLNVYKLSENAALLGIRVLWLTSCIALKFHE